MRVKYFADTDTALLGNSIQNVPQSRRGTFFSFHVLSAGDGAGGVV